MSSVPSPHSPTPEELESLTSAISEVMECSFFALAEILDETRFSEVEQSAYESSPAWWHVAVTFCGPWQGTVTLAIADALARQLHECFAGLMPDDSVSDEEVGQMMSELGNMIAGSWLTKAHRQHKFDLASPVAQKSTSGRPATASATLLCGVNDAPMAVWLRRVCEAAA